MAFHDRNTRMNLFSEDVFISSTLSKIFPVETHSLQFALLSTEHHPDLPPLETKLLKILKDFPFVLSFHDRVKAWNRLLDLDNELGETRVVELKKDGKDITVDQHNVIEYIHLVADYKINK